MPRLRRRPFGLLISAAALIVAAYIPDVGAQTTPGADLVRPYLDGDPLDPPRFRKGGGAPTPRRFTYVPGHGAGRTGFISDGKEGKKAKAAPKAKKKVAAKPYSLSRMMTAYGNTHPRSLGI